MSIKQLSKILCISLIFITISNKLCISANYSRENPIGEKISTSSVQDDSDNDLIPDDIEQICRFVNNLIGDL